MKTKENKKKLFLVNRHTGKSLEWNYQFGRTLPHYSFFNTGKFLNKGQVVELVELEELETEYFGIMRRTDKLTVLERGQLEAFGIKQLEN